VKIMEYTRWGRYSWPRK